MDNTESKWSKAGNTFNKVAAGNFLLMLSLWGAQEVVNKIASPESLARVAVDALSQASTTIFVGTSAIMLTGLATAIAGGSLYLLAKTSLVLKDMAKDLHSDYKDYKKDSKEEKVADAIRFNTDVQTELKQLGLQTNGDPIKTLEVAKFRLSVAILDGDAHKKDIYTEVNKRLTVEPEGPATSITGTELAMG